VTTPENRLLTVFPPFPRFAIVPARTALIVVDTQYLDARPEHGIARTALEAGAQAMFAEYWPAVDKAVACQQRLIRAAHQAGVKVIFTRIATQTRDARDVGRRHRLDDACAAVTPALHQAAITNLTDAFCNCRTTDEVVLELERSR
jgi:nicotinamidase-related amidase